MNNKPSLNVSSCSKVVGRTQQIAALRDLLKVGSSGQKLAFVHGISGTGKSTLVRAALKEQNDDCNNESYYYAEAKFEALSPGRQPYAACLELLTSVLCQTAAVSTLSEEVKVALSKQLSEEDALVLASIIPDDHAVVGLLLGDDHPQRNSITTTLSAKEQFYGAYQRCLSVLVRLQAGKKLILFLDDLQWADKDSLQLFKYLCHTPIATKATETTVLLVGAYRENEMQQDLKDLLQELNNDDNDKSDDKSPLLYVEAGNLSTASIHEWIAGLFEMSLRETQDLAQAVMNRTTGNIFNSIQFLELLSGRNLLYYDDEISLQWRWDIQSIRALNEDVVDLVKFRLEALDLRLQSILKIAGCLGGSKVPIELLKRIVNEIHNLVLEDRDLDVLVQESMLTIETRWISFTHDRIQQAALKLKGLTTAPNANELTLPALRWKIGYFITKILSEETTVEGADSEWMVFASVDQLNRGAACVFDDPAGKLLLAQRNLVAGAKAKEKAAFGIAYYYAESGYDNLASPVMWHDNYELSLSLANLAAECAYLSGSDSRGTHMEDEVIKNASCLEDQLGVWTVRVQKVFARGNIEDAIYQCLHVLKLLGYRLSKRPNLGHATLGLAKIMVFLRRRSDEFIFTLPPMENVKHQAAMKFLAYAGSYAAATNTPAFENLFITSTALMLQLSVQHGACDFTPIAIGHLGILMAFMGNTKASYRFGLLALKLIDETEFKTHTSWVVNLALGDAVFSMAPIDISMDRFLHGYRVAFHGGYLEDAGISAGGYAMSYILTGRCFTPKLRQFAKYATEMKEFQQEYAFELFAPILQFCYNLVGDGDPTVLTGQIMHQGEFLAQLGESKNAVALSVMFALQLELRYIFNSNICEELEPILQEYESICAREVGARLWPNHSHAMFIAGLANFRLARNSETSKQTRKFVGKGQRCIDFLESYVKMGAPPNRWSDKILLLQAEKMTLDRTCSFQCAKTLYEKAAACSSGNGDNRILALSLEHLGEFVRRRGGESLPYFARSAIHYANWGATAKARVFEEKYGIVAKASMSLNDF